VRDIRGMEGEREKRDIRVEKEKGTRDRNKDIQPIKQLID
jgi:hypothetical protein